MVAKVAVKLWTLEGAQASLAYVGPIADELRRLARRVEALDRDVLQVELGLSRRRGTGELMLERAGLVRAMVGLVREIHGAGVRVVNPRVGRLAWSTGEALGTAGLTWCCGERHVQPYEYQGGSAPAEAGAAG